MRTEPSDRDALVSIIQNMIHVGCSRSQLPDGLTMAQYRYAIEELAGADNDAYGQFDKAALKDIADAAGVDRRSAMTSEDLRREIVKKSTSGDIRDEKAAGQAFRKGELKYIATRLVEQQHGRFSKSEANTTVLSKLLGAQ